MHVRILIVDDDRFIRSQLPELIRRASPTDDVTIQAVPGYEDALGLIAPERSDERLIVLCDRNLKAARSGDDVLARVEAERPDAFRIRMSGQSPDAMQPGNDPLVHGHLEKPIVMEEMVAPLRRLIQQAIDQAPNA